MSSFKNIGSRIYKGNSFIAEADNKNLASWLVQLLNEREPANGAYREFLVGRQNRAYCDAERRYYQKQIDIVDGLDWADEIQRAAYRKLDEAFAKRVNSCLISTVKDPRP